jgi:hypothetical protein
VRDQQAVLNLRNPGQGMPLRSENPLFRLVPHHSESPIVSAYFGPLLRDAEREERITPDLKFIDGPIHTAWDLGHGSNMAIWVGVPDTVAEKVAAASAFCQSTIALDVAFAHCTLESKHRDRLAARRLNGTPFCGTRHGKIR